MKKYAIILAAGRGERAGIKLPKQFYIINKKPILIHTIEKFLSIKNIIIILVLAKDKVSYWKKITKNYLFKNEIIIVKGGKTRFKSVNNALQIIKEEGIVAIHDGVRPFVTPKLIEKLFNQAIKKGNAVPYCKLKDSIRKISNNNNLSIKRNNYVLIQTPQVFNIKEIKEAYNKKEKLTYTDDASVYESQKNPINLVEGEDWNLKITSKNDIEAAKYYFIND